MSGQAKKPAGDDGGEKDSGAAGEEFVIRELPDLRELRKCYLRSDGVAADDDDSIPDEPLPEEGSDRFRLDRSTREEALLFYRENVERGDGEDDELTELLDEL